MDPTSTNPKYVEKPKAVALARKVSEEVLESFRTALKIAELYKLSSVKEAEALFEIGFEGGYVEPGASGALTRGKIDVLPTGRNFYAVDPTSIPTKAAWEIGVKTTKMMLEKILKEHGKYPESIGQILWSIDAYKADGEQLAEILYLIGAKPVWDSSGRVVGVELIPLEELGRPRIDVVVRISGIVRDTLPNYIHLIDEAVEKAVIADEPVDMNYVKKHYLDNIEKLAKLGMGFEEARELAKARVWAEPPGAYGAGVNLAVFASAWKNDEDLAKTWIHWSSYAYTKRFYGKRAPDAMVLQLRHVEAVSRHHISDEHDLTNCCCYFAYQGGFHTAVKSVSGKEPLNLWIDTRNVYKAEIRSVKEELLRISYSKLLNPAWIEEMKRHGYRGAYEFMKKLQNLYGWHATTRFVPDEVWNQLAKKYVIELKNWFVENNKFALEEVARRFLEMYRRGLWKAPEELIKQVENVYMEIQALLEGEVSGEAQMGEIWIYTSEDVKSWSENVKDVEKAMALAKSDKGGGSGSK
ncbi:cobaltochelatase subunit CobN [Ignisphaera sp. 4213-co]|uniref:Cobaltochelatase subunit CobN n=1 Tax=Ignisphaera cupida TaxID=3050454 RepID=A0ABD4Z7D5_9CREN|nr:cobaltochelatase subunit CobN [Ignisphaera sp. 4213-co]MDK6028917.1 cobaltochelatase subunit CobN [Ignisphaera sp. 4213-co]